MKSKIDWDLDLGGLYTGSIGIAPAIKEDQMEKQKEHDMDIGPYRRIEGLGLRC